MISFTKSLSILGLAGALMFTGAVTAQTSDATTDTVTETSAAPTGRVMIVLDASGSMLGKIDGQEKIVIARQALSDLLEDWDPKVEVGLIAYGHNRKGDCTDIEVLVPCGPVDKAAIKAVAEAITPLGKTPLSDATIMAAETLKFSEEAATVILISDGEETCEKDPCEVGRELESRGVGFTAHVIGFDISEAKDIAQLKCLAENTGGKFFAAKDAGELKEALSEVVKEVSETPAKPAVSQDLQLSAVYSEGGDPVTGGVNWKIFVETSGSKELSKPIANSYDDVMKPEIPEGKYIVQLSQGDATVQEPWDTTEGPRQLVVNLNAGVLNAVAKASSDADPFSEGLSWKIFKKGEAKSTAAGSYDAEPKFILVAGDYTAKVFWGKAEAESEFTVTAGQSDELEIILPAGVAAAKAVYASEGEEVTEGMKWTVLSDTKNIKGERKSISSSYDANPVFRLPAGKYLLIAKVGEATAEQPLEVKANERSEAELVMNAGILSVKPGTEAADHKSYTIYGDKVDLNGKRKKFSHSYDAEVMFTLQAGKYVLEHEFKDNDKNNSSKEVEVKAGERAEVSF